MRLADHADYRITLHRAGDAPTEKLLVTFGGQPSGISDDGFGTDFCKGCGWDTIYVAQRAWTQYQGLSLEQFVDAVAPTAAGRDVITYGASLGGYAALYFGGAINARIIAAAPMQSLWPEVRTKAMGSMVLKHRLLHEVPASAHLPIVIYDPKMTRDRTVAETIIPRSYPAQRAVQVPYTGHPVLIAMSKARVLKDFIITAVEEDKVLDFQLPTESSAIWLRERGKHMKKANPELAIESLERSLALQPSKNTASILLNLLIDTGRVDQAKSFLERIATCKDRNLGIVPSVQRRAAQHGLDLRDPGPVHRSREKTPNLG